MDKVAFEVTQSTSEKEIVVSPLELDDLVLACVGGGIADVAPY